MYRRMSYTSVEISANLARCQEHMVGRLMGHGTSRLPNKGGRGGSGIGGVSHERTVRGGGGDRSGGGPYRIERRDAMDRAGWGGVDTKPCFVIALEVLDNLPHDRLCWNATPASNDSQGTHLRNRDGIGDGDGGGVEGEGGGVVDGGGGEAGGGGWLGGARRSSRGHSDGVEVAGAGEGGEWMQTRIAASNSMVDEDGFKSGHLSHLDLAEMTEPLTDPLLTRTVGRGRDGCLTKAQVTET